MIPTEATDCLDCGMEVDRWVESCPKCRSENVEQSWVCPLCCEKHEHPEQATDCCQEKEE